jgi:hypothetical protein
MRDAWRLGPARAVKAQGTWFPERSTDTWKSSEAVISPNEASFGGRRASQDFQEAVRGEKLRD